jgi:hypothetical protein
MAICAGSLEWFEVIRFDMLLGGSAVRRHEQISKKRISRASRALK